MSGFLQFINDAGFIGWCIMLVGLGSAGLVYERAQTLYFRFAMKGDDFAAQIKKLLFAYKFDEAIALCSHHPGKPLARAYLTILEKSDRDDDTIFQAHDIALSENIPLLTKRLHYLSMFANVATLMGLLGTIHGLILSFAAVATADPTQKQTLLAHGISVSMYTTALGLIVAIPEMVCYSFLVSRQNTLVEELTEKCGKLTEWVTSEVMDHRNLTMTPPPSVDSGRVATPPPVNAKVS